MEQDLIKKLRGIAMDALARREHTFLELTAKLKKRIPEVEQGVLELVLNELIDEGLLSEERYAENLLNTRLRRGYGEVRIRQELLQKGVCDELINLVIDSVESKVWLDQAKAEIIKKYGVVASEYKEYTKQARFLQYRGFSSEQINQTLKPDSEPFT